MRNFVTAYAEIKSTSPHFWLLSYRIWPAAQTLQSALREAQDAADATLYWAPARYVGVLRTFLTALALAFHHWGFEGFRRDALMLVMKLWRHPTPDYDAVWLTRIAAELLSERVGFPDPATLRAQPPTVQERADELGRELQARGLSGGVVVLAGDPAPMERPPTPQRERSPELDAADVAREVERQLTKLRSDDPTRAGALLTRAAMLEAVGDDRSLRDALACVNQAAALTQEPIARANLEVARVRLLRRTGKLTTAHARSDAIASLKRFAIDGVSIPALVVDAAAEWGRTAGENDDDEAARGFGRALAALDDLLAQTFVRRFDAEALLRKAPPLVADAAYAQARGGDPTSAVETLEGFRAVTGSGLRLTVAPELNGEDARGELAGEALREGAMPQRVLTEASTRQREAMKERGSRIRFPGDVHFSDLVGVAASVGPLCYLTAGSRGGLCLIVYSDGSARAIECPGLTIDAVFVLIRDYQQGYHGARRAVASAFDAGDEALLDEGLALFRRNLDKTAAWLWDTAMCDVVAGISPADACCLLPGGWLSVLPLHAAGNDAEGVLDSCAIRYLPSSSFAWRADAWEPRAFVGCGDPYPGDVGLTGSENELRVAAEHFSESLVLVHANADRQHVLDAVKGADVVHFACHGGAVAGDPRTSYLRLHGDPLTVLDVEFGAALSSRHPLVVLSACETALPGAYAVDELVGMPLAWLETGAAAVVAPQWAVDTQEAAILTGSFYSLWRGGRMPPWQALRYAMRDRREALRAEGAADDPIAWAAFTFWG